MIDTDRLPIVARGGQPGEEYPARGFDVETGILFQPMADMSLRPTGDRRQPRYPPAIDLQWPEVVAAVAVCDFRANPAAFLITQSPERLGKPIAAGG